MYSAPFRTEMWQLQHRSRFNLRYISRQKTIILSQLRWPAWAIQFKNGLAITDNMHMSGPMIVRVNHNPQSVYFVYFWHCITKPKRLGYFLNGT